ncbi:TMEM175 family protein [[Eubacterium] cellulosolvens]
MNSNNKDDKYIWVLNLNTTRLEALSDGVFAIAMTLLVLELSVPYFTGTGNAGHPTSFSEMWGEFYTYGIGFFSLGVYWILHHYVFSFIKRSDGLLVWLNITFLALASLVPFWTQVLTYSGGPGPVIFYYGIYMVVTFFVLLTILYYATIGYRLVDRNIDEQYISGLKRILLIGIFLVAVVAVSSYFIPWTGHLFIMPAAFFVIATIYISWIPKKAKTIEK